MIMTGEGNEKMRYIVPEEAHNKGTREFTSKWYLTFQNTSRDHFQDWISCIRMRDVGGPIAHTIAHCYATGAYETIATVAYDYTSMAKTEYRRSIEIYMVSKNYKLTGLQELARGHMTGIATQMSISEIFNVLGDVKWEKFKVRSSDDANPDKWMLEVHFRERVKAACESEYDQLDEDFRDFSQLNRTLHGRFVQEVVDILREVYLQKSYELVRDLAALKKSIKMKHQSTPTPKQGKEEVQECSPDDEMEEIEDDGDEENSEDGSVTPERTTPTDRHLESTFENISTCLFYPVQPSY
jgi:hypothetical protein